MRLVSLSALFALSFYLGWASRRRGAPRLSYYRSQPSAN